MVHNNFILGVTALAFCTFSISASAKTSAADCETRYTSLDTGHVGYLTDKEGEQYFAFYRLGNKTLADNKLTKDQFLADCTAGFYDNAAVDAGAPLKGANSFTEAQAKDRIASHGGGSVSALTKDADGIWRGTASKDGGEQKVAVDFKGNVVFNK